MPPYDAALRLPDTLGLVAALEGARPDGLADQAVPEPRLACNDAAFTGHAASRATGDALPRSLRGGGG